MADPADRSPDESDDHASRPAAAPARRPWEAADALEANGEGLTRARTAGFEGHSALEFAEAFSAGCSRFATTLEAATEALGPAAALATALRLRPRDGSDWAAALRLAATTRH